MQDADARLQSAVTTAEANMLRHLLENAVRRTAVSFKMDGGRFKYIL
jgi:hypothetical protein